MKERQEGITTAHEDFVKMMSRTVVGLVKERERRETAQHAVERVVKTGFNRDNVPNFLKVYNVEMNQREVNEAERLKCSCRVVAAPVYEEAKKLQEAHNSWGYFEKALTHKV